MKGKIWYIGIIILIICLNPISKVFAKTQIDSAIADGDSFISKADSSEKVINMSNLETFSGQMYNVILIIGMVVAVIAGLILGIKFMISSVEEKAKIKGILIVYTIGCIVLFGAFSIWKVTVELLNKV